MPRAAGGIARRARGRIHRAVDQPVADRRVSADLADGRHPRPIVPRIHRDAVHGDPGLAGDFADHDADDVRAILAHARYRAIRRADADRSIACSPATSTRSAGHCGTAVIVLVIFFGAIGLNVVLFSIVPKGFFPEQDTGRLIGSLQADQSVSFQADDAKTAADDGHRAARSGGGTRRRLHRRRQWRRLWPDQHRLGLRLAETSDRATPRQSIRSSRGCGRNLPKCPAGGLFFLPSRIFASVAARATRNINTRCRPTIRTELFNWTPLLVQALEHSKVMADVRSDQQQTRPGDPILSSTGRPLRGSASLRHRSTIRSTMPSGSAKSRSSIARSISITSSWRSTRATRSIRRRCAIFMWRLPAAARRGRNNRTRPSGAVTAVKAASATTAASAGATAAANANNNSARNAAINALANTGRSATSSGAAVSTAVETMVPLAALEPLQCRQYAVVRQSPGIVCRVHHFLQFDAGYVARRRGERNRRRHKANPHAGDDSRQSRRHGAGIRSNRLPTSRC